MRTITPALPAVLFCLALGGCLKSSDPPPAIYRLDMAVQEREIGGGRRVISMSEPEVPAGFDTSRITLYLHNGRQLDYFADSVWPERLGKVLQGALEDAGQAVGIKIVSSDSGAYSLSIKVKDFEPVYAAGPNQIPLLRVSLTFRLMSRQSQKIVLETTQRAEAPATANTRTAIVTGLESLLKKAAGRGFAKISRKL